MALQGISGTAKTVFTDIRQSTPFKPPAKKDPVIKRDEFYTGALSRGNENVLGQCTRKEFINEFITFWKDDYRAKIKCACLLGMAIFTFNVFAPFALFCIALAAKYWDWAMWCRNIARFNGNFRTIIVGQ